MSAGREIAERDSEPPECAQPKPTGTKSRLETTPLRSDAHELEAKPVSTRPDPFARVRSLGDNQTRHGMAVGLAIALSVHGAAAARGATALVDMGAFAALVQTAVRDDIRATYAVEMTPAKPPPPPPQAEPPPPDEKVVQPKAVSRNPTTEAPPPAPAQAGKVLTANPDPDAPVDLTGDGFVSGEADRYVGGVTSAKGTSSTPVSNTAAKPGGKIGGTGHGPVDAVPTKQDLSVSAKPAESDWDCAWPPEADTEQINYMRVRIVVTVGLDGRAQKVTVLNDPGHGFGKYVQQCAFRKGFSVALNSDGKPVISTTPPFSVTFRR